MRHHDTRITTKSQLSLGMCVAAVFVFVTAASANAQIPYYGTTQPYYSFDPVVDCQPQTVRVQRPVTRMIMQPYTEYVEEDVVTLKRVPKTEILLLAILGGCHRFCNAIFTSAHLGFGNT
ncbi:MAG: hypothetical protein AAFP69_10190, partial [Planctomycetota bacterium]